MGALSDIPQWVLWVTLVYAVLGFFILISTSDDALKFAILVGDVFKIFALLCIVDALYRILLLGQG